MAFIFLMFSSCSDSRADERSAVLFSISIEQNNRLDPREMLCSTAITVLVRGCSRLDLKLTINNNIYSIYGVFAFKDIFRSRTMTIFPPQHPLYKARTIPRKPASPAAIPTRVPSLKALPPPLFFGTFRSSPCFLIMLASAIYALPITP